MRRTYICMYVHFVWSTARREPLITPTIERRLHRYIQGVCLKLGCKPLASGGTTDHVHLLLSVSATITLADIMEQVKGSSSHFASEELLDGEWFAWQEGYGAISVSPHDKARVIRYINNQKQHHADGTLWPRAERMDKFSETKPEQAGKQPQAK